MQRVRHLVAYDIRDPTRLRAVGRAMRGFGFRMQYSVFVCDLDAAERLRLLRVLGGIIDETVDAVAVVELGDPGDRRPFTYLGPHNRGFRKEDFFI